MILEAFESIISVRVAPQIGNIIKTRVTPLIFVQFAFELLNLFSYYI